MTNKQTVTFTFVADEHLSATIKNYIKIKQDAENQAVNILKQAQKPDLLRLAEINSELSKNRGLQREISSASFEVFERLRDQLTEINRQIDGENSLLGVRKRNLGILIQEQAALERIAALRREVGLQETSSGGVSTNSSKSAASGASTGEKSGREKASFNGSSTVIGHKNCS